MTALEPLFSDAYIEGLGFEETKARARQMNADWVSGVTLEKHRQETGATSPAAAKPAPSAAMTQALGRLRSGPEAMLAARAKAAAVLRDRPANWDDLNPAAQSRFEAAAKGKAKAIVADAEAALQADRDVVNAGVEKLSAPAKPATDEGRMAQMMASQHAYDRLQRLGALDGSDVTRQRAAILRAVADAAANDDRAAFDVLRRELALDAPSSDPTFRKYREQLLGEIDKAEDPLRSPAERQGREVAAEVDAGWSRLQLALGEKPAAVTPSWDGARHLSLDPTVVRGVSGVELFDPSGDGSEAS